MPSPPDPAKTYEGSPNRLRAVFTHFPELCCALIGLSVVVLVAVLDDGFKVKTYFSTQYISELNNRNVIVVLCLVAVFLFFEAVQKSFFAQCYNIADMTPLERQLLFGEPEDPVNYVNDETAGEKWKTLLDAHLKFAKTLTDQAILRLEMGTVSLFLSVSFLLGSYAESFWIGVVCILLIILYAIVLVRDHRRSPNPSE